MRQGGTCGCITASLLVLGMALGFYDSQDKEKEVYGNKKTEEFIRRFTEQMKGVIYCRDILGKDISKPNEMADIRKEGLILKKCPDAINISIEILEDMLSEYFKDIKESSIRPEDIPEDDEMESIIKRVSKLRRFNRNVNNLIHSSSKEIAFIQFDARICKFKDVKLQMSYGVYTVEDREMEMRQMSDRAAMTRKAAKSNIVTNILFYKEQFKDMLYNRKFIEENIQTAIDSRQLKMYLQPKYSINRNTIIGAEALIRWDHPEKGMIFPNQFIPIIEENGFIKQVDYYIWKEACRFIRKCIDSGITDCPVSVNVSRVHLQDDECIYVLSNLVNEYEIPKRLLELEITETVNDQQVSMKAFQLKEEGYTLLMDDFGSGYSSLNILLETPFDVIKLDKKFMDNMMVSPKGRLILEQVVLMSDKLQLGILAEGVETREQVTLLKNIGCDQVQGYYYAKPMPDNEFLKLLLKEHEML